MQPIYKILPAAIWHDALARGRLEGAPVDLADGFIHLSSRAQVEETAARHFSGQDGLLLLAVDVAALGDDLRWEASRGGALFPHLYAPLLPAAVLWARPLLLRASGMHEFAGLLP